MLPSSFIEEESIREKMFLLFLKRLSNVRIWKSFHPGVRLFLKTLIFCSPASGVLCAVHWISLFSPVIYLCPLLYTWYSQVQSFPANLSKKNLSSITKRGEVGEASITEPCYIQRDRWSPNLQLLMRYVRSQFLFLHVAMNISIKI